MIIEIRKAGFVNKGAEMMLLSIIENIQTKYPDTTFVMAPSTEKGSQPYSKLSRLGFKLKFRLRRGKVDISWIGNLIPKKVRDAYGIVLNKEIDIILDASGFSYSDQWGTYDTEELKDALTNRDKKNQKFILLPQAFGPFENESNIINIDKALKAADLVFARDAYSMQSLKKVIEPFPKNIFQSPDFTCGLAKSITNEVENKAGMVAIVPNYRMLDKTRKDDRDSYVDNLVEAIKILLANGLKPYFLIHETDLDKGVALEIMSKLKVNDIPCVEEDNPRVIKGYLSVSSFVISSRYHASVSALSQSVPVIGTSWSHKYQELFREYDFEEGLSELANSEQIKRLTNSLCNESYRDEVSNKLKINSEKVKVENDAMWSSVFEVIDSSKYN